MFREFSKHGSSARSEDEQVWAGRVVTNTVVFLSPSPFASRQCICEDMCMFEIRFAEGVEEDLRKIRIYYRNQILDAVEEQLAHEPGIRTRNRKLLDNLIPPWQTVAPIWELRVGEYRVFYDVSPTESVVYVRAVRRKPRGTKTEDIL
jgi:mRNA-degrading endonuclease RelE of RelBE toxin-antitoxin system